jgi:hypothetical protein
MTSNKCEQIGPNFTTTAQKRDLDMLSSITCLLAQRLTKTLVTPTGQLSPWLNLQYSLAAPADCCEFFHPPVISR